MAGPSKTPRPDTPQPPQLPRVWWPFWIGLLAWNLFLFWPTGKTQAQIPYSTFVAQVKAGNVASVEIRDQDITGAFVKPVTLPQPGAKPGASPAPTTSESAFHTIFPGAASDPTLLPLLEQKGVVIDVKSPPSPVWGILLAIGLPVVFLLVGLQWVGRQAMRNQTDLFGFGRSKARRYTPDRPGVTFNDVAGADEAKSELEEEVDFLRHPEKYAALGARIPRGVLLVGPPGTGKTLLARAVAGEAGVPFFSLSGSEFVEMFVGVGASRVRSLFEQAKAAAPAIVFIDELDAVGRRRGAGIGQVNDEREQTLNQLLVEMDGFDEHQQVILLAATNRPDVLDPALLRPGRFDRHVEVALPDRAGREAILRIHTRPLKLAADVNLKSLAAGTPGFSGADLANLCNEAALIAARMDHHEVARADFDEAVDKLLLGGKRPSLLDPRDRRTAAYHESGHALVAWFTPGADPVHKVSIIPRGRTLGATEQLPGEERQGYRRDELLARLAVMLGGRAAEEIVMGDISTGAENDLVEATKLARRMITRWGMGGLGPVAFKADEEQPFLGYEISQGRDYGEATADRIDEEMRAMLEKQAENARALLRGHRAHLERLAGALMEQEAILGDALPDLLGPRPAAAREDAAPTRRTP